MILKTTCTQPFPRDLRPTVKSFTHWYPLGVIKMKAMLLYLYRIPRK